MIYYKKAVVINVRSNAEAVTRLLVYSSAHSAFGKTFGNETFIMVF